MRKARTGPSEAEAVRDRIVCFASCVFQVFCHFVATKTFAGKSACWGVVASHIAPAMLTELTSPAVEINTACC